MNESQIKEWFTKLRHELTEGVIDKEKALNAFDHLRAAYNNLPSNPTFKFNIGQEVWLLKDNKVQKGFVRVRQITESRDILKEESHYFKRDTSENLITIYSLRRESFSEIDPNWQIQESELFATKQELLNSL